MLPLSCSVSLCVCVAGGWVGGVVVVRACVCVCCCFTANRAALKV